MDLSLASIDVPVDYRFTVVDVIEPLNAFDTHASIFDAHPNGFASGASLRLRMFLAPLVSGFNLLHYCLPRVGV